MSNPFFDISLPVEERINWLLGELTMEEKLRCMATRAPSVERLGIHGFSVGGEAAHGVEARNDQNELGAAEETTSFVQPIGMSASWDTELIRQAGEVTGTEARVIYHRHPDRGLSRWAPTVDLERDPRWGRTEEGYGEDPVLTGAMASAYIQGMQGDDPQHLRIAATLKHFYGNNAERGRGWKSASIDPRNRMELYLEPFRRCIVDGRAEAVMTAYNKINGVPGMLNPEVRTILKEQYGLHHAVCDGGAMELVKKLHHYYGSHAETFAAAVKAGVDAMSDNPEVVERAAREAFARGLITESEIDEALGNLFRTKLRLGIYDSEPVNPYDLVTEEDLCCERHRAVSRQMAEEAVVLLKNENGMLPLGRADTDVAVIGPLADVWYQDWYGGMPPYRTTLCEGIAGILGRTPASADGYDRVLFRYGGQGLAVAEDETLVLRDSPDVFVKQDWGGGNFTFYAQRTGKYLNLELQPAKDGEPLKIRANADAPFDWFVTELFHIKETDDGLVRLTSRMDLPLSFDPEGRLVSCPCEDIPAFRMEVVESGMEKACALARESGTVILALGCSPMINAKEEIDRTTLALPPAQQKLLEGIYGCNKNTVLVLFSNYPYTIGWAQEHIPAILWSATGSQDMGSAMAAHLFGEAAPAGRLNLTWYRSDDQLPDIDDYDIIRGNRTYRYFDGDVLYPFGYGLTYTKFSYSDLRVQLCGGRNIRVAFCVTNAGETVSDEVVQVYGKAPASRVKKPLRQLLAFRRLKKIRPHETRTAEFMISAEEFSFYDTISRSMMVEEGEYQIFAGSSSRDLPLKAKLWIAGRHTGRRFLENEQAADHFDDYENIVLGEGHFGCTAAMPRTRDEEGVLIYRDCRLPEKAGTIWLHLKSVNGGRVEILLDQKLCGEWAGDTRTYEAEPGFFIDGKAREEQPLVQAGWEAVYTDVRILLTRPEPVSETAALQIRLSGDVKVCYFWTE